MSSSSAELIETAGRLLVGSDLTVKGNATVQENTFLEKNLVVGENCFVQEAIVGAGDLFLTGDSTVLGNTVTYGATTSVGTISAVGAVNVGTTLSTTDIDTRGSVDVATTVIARTTSGAGGYFGHAPSLTGVMPWAQFIGTSTNGGSFGDYTIGQSPFFFTALNPLSNPLMAPLPTVSISTGFNFLTPVLQPTGFYLIEGYLVDPLVAVNAESIMTTVRWDGTRLWGCSASQYFTLTSWTTDYDCIETGQGFFDYDQAVVEVSYTSTKGTVIQPLPGVTGGTKITMNVYKLADYGQVLQPLPPAPVIPSPPLIPVTPNPPSPPTPAAAAAQRPMSPPPGMFIPRKKPKPMPMGPIPQ